MCKYILVIILNKIRDRNSILLFSLISFCSSRTILFPYIFLYLLDGLFCIMCMWCYQYRTTHLNLQWSLCNLQTVYSCNKAQWHAPLDDNVYWCCNPEMKKIPLCFDELWRLGLCRQPPFNWEVLMFLFRERIISKRRNENGFYRPVERTLVEMRRQARNVWVFCYDGSHEYDGNQ